MSESEANIQIESKLESEVNQAQTEKGKERDVAGDQHSLNQIKHQDRLEDEIELKPLSSKRLDSDPNLNQQEGDEKEKLNQIAASQATDPLSLSPDQPNISTSTTSTYYPYNFNPTTNTFSFQSRSRTDPQSSNSNPIQIARSATTLHGIPSNTTTNHLHPSNTPRTGTREIAAQPGDNGNGNGVENEAVAVRRNMLRGAWAGFGALGRGRRYVLMFRIAIALAQVAAGITVLSLPTSLGDSFARPEVCDPEGMFVFLTLHVIRVICSIPIDIYLGLSPHRNSRARRVGAQGQEERERNRIVGNLVLDRKLSRLSDLFGFVHVVLFVVGNYLVYSSTECSKPPADSVALFWTSFSMLAISYFVILEIALLVFAVVFFLPALVALLRALGFAGNLVNPNRINPETGKVDIEKVDGSSKLYYFVPMEKENEDEELKEENGIEGEGEGEGGGRSSLQELRISMAENAWKESLRNDQEVGEIHEASQIPLPDENDDDDDDDEIEETFKEDESKINTSKPNDSIIKKEPVESIPNSKSKRRSPWKFWRKSFTSPPPTFTTTQISNPSDSNLQIPIKEPSTTSISHSYPFLPLPSHRSTCPICLDDYREPSKTQKDKDEDGNELEPLRLLGCNHALHRSCVDTWLTTVSGRCPVCQRPIDKEEGGEDGGENQA